MHRIVDVPSCPVFSNELPRTDAVEQSYLADGKEKVKEGENWGAVQTTTGSITPNEC